MRFLLLVFLSVAACEACGPKPKKPVAEYGGAGCQELRCNDLGVCECTK